MTTFDIVSFQYSYHDDTYEQNFEKLVTLLAQTDDKSFICASELCLTNFSYRHMDKAAEFSNKCLKEILPMTKEKTLCLTVIEKFDEGFVNSGKIIHNGQIIHTQEKYRLFTLGEELKYFQRGDKEKIKIVQIGDIKVAMLICFELRFVDLWQMVRGADIIFIPALWGKPRKMHLETLSRSLAIINQCYVIVSNASNDDMASSSTIISPMGEQLLDDSKNILQLEGSLHQVALARRYLDMDI